MRNLFFLAFIGFLFICVASGCGALATNTCSNGNWNTVACPGLLAEAIENPTYSSEEEAYARDELADDDDSTSCSDWRGCDDKLYPWNGLESNPNTDCVLKGRSFKKDNRLLIKGTGSREDCRIDTQLLEWRLINEKSGTECAMKNGEIVCAGFGHISGIFLILLTLMWGRGLCGFVVANEENKGTRRPFDGMWPACRTMIIAVVGVVTILAAGGAYGACTETEIASNKVGAQYGIKLYNCDKDEAKDEVSQEDKDAVFEVIWRGFVAKGGLKMGMSKEYIRKRWARAETAFWSVWKSGPLWQAQVAAAICVRETNCGVTVKFSEWETHRFESLRNSNGSVDCGITQINSQYTEFTCDELQDLDLAFQEQRRHIFMATDNASEKAYWQKNIHRYNGAEAYEYGKKVWEWSGASS